jgi:hypothetical protein
MASARNKARRDRRARHLSQRTYALRQVRPAFLRVGIPVALLLFGLAGGALSMHAWLLRGSAAGVPGAAGASGETVAAPCAAVLPAAPAVPAAPPTPDAVEAELERTRLALAQEKASRAAVQKSADASAAEASRLGAEVKFLRGEASKPR